MIFVSLVIWTFPVRLQQNIKYATVPYEIRMTVKK